MADKKNIVLKYAFLMFTEKGYSNVTMDEIARGCGIGKATIYKYFPSKEELLMSCITYNTIGIENSISRILDDNNLTPMQKICMFLNPVLKLIQNVKSSNLDDIKRNVPEAYARINSERERLIMLNISKILKEGKKSGIFSDDIDETLETHIIIGAISHILNPQILCKFSYAPDQLLRKIINMILKGCFADSEIKMC